MLKYQIVSIVEKNSPRNTTTQNIAAQNARELKLQSLAQGSCIQSMIFLVRITLAGKVGSAKIITTTKKSRWSGILSESKPGIS